MDGSDASALSAALAARRLPPVIRPLALILVVLMFSLAGIPPLAGFFAKFFVFAAAIKAGLYTLAVIGVVSWSTAAGNAAGCGGLTGVTPIARYRAWIVEEARRIGSGL